MFRQALLILFLFFAQTSFGQDISNRGKEFWLGYNLNFLFFTSDGGTIPQNSQELVLYISAEQAATVTVSVNSTGWSQTINIPGNTVDISITIPKSGANDARLLSDGLSTRGIHIVSDVPVAVFAHHYSTANSAATMLMPVESWGYKYHAVSYTQLDPDGFEGIAKTKAYSLFYITASEDNTKVEITPSDSTENGWLPNQPYTISLDKGQIYVVYGKNNPTAIPARVSKDMTGSKILSIPGVDGKCHPIGVFSGSGLNRICKNNGGENIIQQVFPEQAWGTRYLTYHTIGNIDGDFTQTNRNYYRVCLSNPSTIVKRNGVPLTGLTNNFYYEFVDSTDGDFIESDKPILVAQYLVGACQCWKPAPPQGETDANKTLGDPEMIFISPMEQGQKSARYYVSQNQQALYDYTNVYLPTAAVASLKVDGVTVTPDRIIPHPHLPSYSVAFIRHPSFGAPPIASQHIITCDSNFTAFVYGLGFFESYGYNVGTRINNLNNYSAIHNTYNTNGNVDTFTCPGTSVRLFIKLGFQANSITWKLSQVPGLSVNVDSVVNNPVPIGTEIINGRTYYVYTLQQDFTFAAPGTYTIPYSYSSLVIENCSKTEFGSMQVIVKNGPTADFTISNTLCIQDTIRLADASAPGIFNIVGNSWDFDDLTTQNGPTAAKRFLTAGDHPVQYTIVADNGCSSKKIKTVSLSGSPVAVFGASDHICSSDSVYITDTSVVASGTIINRYWDFGDGQTANLSNGNYFYHKYTGAGPYIIALVVTSSNGCHSDTLRKTINLIPSPPAKFGFDHSVCLGDAITFTDSSHLYSNTITSWNWDFGNGISAVKTSFAPFSYTYPAAGVYTVTLVTLSSNGCKSDTSRLPVAVTDKPSANFSFSGKLCADSTITFMSATAYNASVPSAWYWNFGDTHTALINSSANSTHTYSSGTNFSVKHAVTYGGCVSDTVTNIIPAIHENPVVDFDINPSAICQNATTFFTGTASPDVILWQWNFGTATGNDLPPFSKIYAQVYNGPVTLKVFTAAGCGSLTTARIIQVGAAPVVDAGPDIFLKTGESKTIAASISNANNYNFLWIPATSLSSDIILNPITTAATSILYKIEATDKSTGCKSYDSVWVKPFSGIYVPNTFTPNADGKNDTWHIPALEAYPNSRITIYNRYAQKIFDSPGNVSHWDGTFRGEAQPTGVYVYIINTGDAATGVLRGTILLVR